MACTRDVAAHKVRRILLSLKSPRQISANEQACALPLDPTPPHNCTRTPGIPRRKAVVERTVQSSIMPAGFGAAAAGVSRARGCTLAAILVLAVALVMLQGARGTSVRLCEHGGLTQSCPSLSSTRSASVCTPRAVPR